MERLGYDFREIHFHDLWNLADMGRRSRNNRSNPLPLQLAL
jgi:hypothetical protein